ncbi:mediator of RNA polymerase II transcription subunit 15 isoform X2 [Penaeus vannamei]|uniref:mediator of RNA polymerase II transcription subunit 15 isoform X2 n=1 Tax=Penaeus vannamei TaxID=6689 RepID=UPI00387F78CC
MEGPHVVRPLRPAQCHASLFDQLGGVFEAQPSRSYSGDDAEPERRAEGNPLKRSWSFDERKFGQLAHGGGDARERGPDAHAAHHPRTAMMPPPPPLDQDTRRQLDEFEEVISRMETMSGGDTSSRHSAMPPPPPPPPAYPGAAHAQRSPAHHHHLGMQQHLHAQQSHMPPPPPPQQQQQVQQQPQQELLQAVLQHHQQQYESGTGGQSVGGYECRGSQMEIGGENFLSPTSESHLSIPQQVSPHVSPHVSQQVSPHVSQQVSPHVSQQVSPHVSQQVSPHVSQHVSPHVSRQGSPHVSPQVSPFTSPHTSPSAAATPPIHSRPSTPQSCPPSRRSSSEMAPSSLQLPSLSQSLSQPSTPTPQVKIEVTGPWEGGGGGGASGRDGRVLGLPPPAPPSNVKAMPTTSRTQLKQQLMRQQLQQQQEQRDRDARMQQQQMHQQQMQHLQPGQQGRPQHQQHQQQHQQHQHPQQQPQLQHPPQPAQQPQEPIAIPTSVPQDVPPQVLQVQTRLENPTFYHVLQSQRRQVLQFLSGSGSPGDASGSGPPHPNHPPAWPHSDPGVAMKPTHPGAPNASTSGAGGSSSSVGGAVAVSAPRVLARGPCSPEAASTSRTAASTPAPSTAPASVVSSVISSSAASLSDASEVEDVIDEILNLEEGLDASDNLKAYDQVNNMPSSMNTVPGSICDLLGLNGYMGKTANSCPPDLPQVKNETTPINDQQMVAYMKDRQKKDNHNMIERRRRFNINDRIKELATLLPKSNEPYFELVRDLRHNKGQILKASVDYIKRLKLDTEYNKEVELKRRALEQQNRQLLLRIQELESKLRSNGIKVEETNIDQSLLLSTIIKSEVVNNTGEQNDMKKELLDDFTSGGFNLDLMDDDGPAFTSDPVFSSPQVSSPNSSHHSFDDALTPDSMDIVA